MRPVSFADIEVAVRVLICVPPQARAKAMADLLDRADVADRYRKRVGRRHPQFGSGTLMSAAQNQPVASRPAFLDKDAHDALFCIINALNKNTTHQLP